MALTDSFGKSSSTLIAEQSAARKKQLNDLLDSVVRPEDKGTFKQAAASTGAALGQGIGQGIAKAAGWTTPEDEAIKRAQSVETKLQAIEDEWEDDPEKDATTNMADKIDLQIKTLGSDIDPQQRLQLQAQKLALLGESFERSRLTAADQRALEDHKVKMRDSEIDYDITKIKLQAAQDVMKHGDEAALQVYKMPDGSQAMIGRGSQEDRDLRDLTNDPNSGVEYLGSWSDIQARQLATLKSTARLNKPIKYTQGEKKDFIAYNELAENVQFLNTPEAQQAIDRFRSWDALTDIAREEVASLLPDSWGVSAKSPSTDVATRLANLSIAIQSVIKGVPSNFDQYLIELTKADRWNTAPEVANSRIAYLGNVVTMAVRSTIADHYANAPVDQPLPAGLAAAAQRLGIKMEDLRSVEEEEADLLKATSNLPSWDPLSKKASDSKKKVLEF